MNKESNFERLQTILSGKKPDRASYVEYWYVNQAVVETVLGRKLPPLGWYEDAISAPDNFEFSRKIGMDAVTTDWIYRPGHVSGVSETGDMHYAGGTIRNRKDFEEKMAPAPDLSWVREKAAAHAALRRSSSTGVIHTLTGVLDPAYLAMGMENFMLLLYDDPQLVNDMLDHFLHAGLAAMEEICAFDEIDIICINDDVCTGTGPIVSPAMMKDLWYPRIKKLIELPKARGKIITYHSDGKLEPILPWLHELGFQAAHPVEPYANDIYALKKTWGQKLCLMGNIDITLLRFGKPDEIRKDVRTHLEKLGPKRYIVSSSNSLIQDIPPENFLAMTETVREFIW